MKGINNVFEKIQNAINNLTAVLLLVIMVVIFAQTFCRFVIFKSLPWSEELSRYLFVIMILLGANIGISKNMMVRIDIVDNLVSDKIKHVFAIIREVLALAITCFLVYSTFPMIQLGAFQKSPALQIQMSVMYSIMAAGFVLMVMAVLLRLLNLFIKKEEV